jgi:hypothetical protein
VNKCGMIVSGHMNTFRSLRFCQIILVILGVPSGLVGTYVDSVPATRQIIGVGPTTRISAMEAYIKQHTENTEQTTRQYTAVLTQPSIDESQIELFDRFSNVAVRSAPELVHAFGM